MEILVDLIKSLGVWGGAALIVFGLVWYFHCSTLVENAASRAAALAALRDDTATKRYRRWLTRALDGLDARLSKDESALPPTSARVAWSGGLAGANFALALAYPVLSVLALWVVTGNGTVAGRVVIAAEDNVLLRGAVAVAICSMVFGVIFASQHLLGTRRLVTQIVAGTLVLFLAQTLLQGSTAGAALVGAAYIVSLIAVLSAKFGPFPNLLTITGALALVASTAAALAQALSGLIFLAATIPLLLLFSGTFLIEGRAAARASGGAAFAMLGTVFFALSLVAVGLSNNGGISKSGIDISATSLFLSLLPLLNGLADFASCGLTRWLMRRGVVGQTVWRGVLDSVTGLGIFLVLGFAIITVVHFVRPQNGVALADLTAIFDGLVDPETRGNYGWLLFMLATPLIPTVLHFAVAVAAFFTLYPAGLRHWIIERLESGAAGHANAGRQGQAVLALAISAAVLIPSWLLWQIFTMRHGLLDGLITLFRLFAEVIGAIPSGMAI